MPNDFIGGLSGCLATPYPASVSRVRNRVFQISLSVAPATQRGDRRRGTFHAWQDARMSQHYGMESPGAHHHAPLRKPARYLVIIDSGGSTLARLFGDAREQVAEFDAGTEEVAQMTQGLQSVPGALGPEWNLGLEGHSATERGAAEVYTLDV